MRSSWADKGLIVFSGPDENGPSGKGRSDLRLRYSTDEAKSWKDGPLDSLARPLTATWSW